MVQQQRWDRREPDPERRESPGPVRAGLAHSPGLRRKHPVFLGPAAWRRCPVEWVAVVPHEEAEDQSSATQLSVEFGQSRGEGRQVRIGGGAGAIEQVPQ